MVSESKKIVVGFFPPHDKSWMGGVNYYQNLFYALSLLDHCDFKYVAFVGFKSNPDVVKLYQSNNISVVQHRIFDYKSVSWFIDKIALKLFRNRFLLNRLMKKHSIAVISHVQSDIHADYPTIGWIPDFQHVHLPEMFSEQEIINRNKHYFITSQMSDSVVMSSHDALKDYRNFAADFASKGKTLQFVSQPPDFYFELDNNSKKTVLDKYSISEPYIYVPNQFWRHKNHDTLFRAVLIAKQKGSEPLVVCSGLMSDYRGNEHVDRLVDFIEQNDLSANIKLLGLIPYEDVFRLIKFSKVVLNPSKFEGWSSSVEECKSVNKMMLLSDIAVHKEQYPEAIFFEVDSADSLAERIIRLSDGSFADPVVSIPSLRDRTLAYAERYLDIVTEVVNRPHIS